MMMTSGESVKYSNSRQAFAQIIKEEGAKAFFHGAAANVIRAIAGALVLTGFDHMQTMLLERQSNSDLAKV